MLGWEGGEGRCEERCGEVQGWCGEVCWGVREVKKQMGRGVEKWSGGVGRDVTECVG